MEYQTIDDMFSDISKQLLNHDTRWKKQSRDSSGTGDNYKLSLIEQTQFFNSIHDMTSVITGLTTQRQHPFWAVSECLSEIFAFNPPLMHKYKPQTIEWAYKLRADKSVEYMYGRRWNEWNQLLNVIKTLSERQDSKRAVIDIFTPYDTDPARKDIPCTLMYDFKLRNSELDMAVFFRSHDLFSGIKYDVILSSFIAQIILMGVNAETDCHFKPGKLSMYEGSLHVYDSKDSETLDKFLTEKPFHHDCKFNLMHDYDSISSIFDDLWRVEKAEDSSYWGNFKVSLEQIDKIENPAFKDFAKVYYNRNLKQYKRIDNALRFDTNILLWNSNVVQKTLEVD